MRSAVRWGPVATLAVMALTVGPQAGRCQDELEVVVEEMRGAWMAHDMGALVASSDTIRLDVPGVAVSASLRPGQAERLLDRYLESAQEHTFVVAGIRRLADDHAYAEVERRYVVRGTSEEQLEMVFLGFRRIEGRWCLREVRVRR